MSKKTKGSVDAACDLLRAELGDWWNDGRRNWCAYCGIPMRVRSAKGKPTPPQQATKDHFIPRAHNGSVITIPACSACNREKGAKSFQEFLLSNYFAAKRRQKHRNKWPVQRLWMVASLAALEQARTG
jgi:HNH endonuclease